MASIKKRGTSYLIKVSLGYSADGNQQAKFLTWTPPVGMTKRQIEKELNRQAVLFEEQCRNGKILNDNIRFGDFVKIWWRDYAENNLRKKTMYGYKHQLQHITAAFGQRKLKDITPTMIYAFYDNLREVGIREDDKYQSIVDFKELLKEKKYTKKVYAEKAKIGTSTVDALIAGRNVSRATAKSVSAAMEIPFQQLFMAANPGVLSENTILHYHHLLSSILQKAVHWQYLMENPLRRVEPPKKEKKRLRYLQEEDVQRLVDALESQDIRYRTAVIVLLLTGMRRGELMGLDWADIDWDRSLIHITKTVQYLPEEGIFSDETKNESSCRTIKVGDEVLKVLQEYQNAQEMRKREIGDLWTDCGRVFVTWDGKAMNPDVLSSWFRGLVRKNDLPDISIHSLRHTAASFLIAHHHAVSTVAGQLGHASPDTTMKIYTHELKSAQAEAAEALQSMILTSPKPSKSDV